MRGLKMARGSPLGKGAGTGVRRERRMERTSRFLVFDILLIVYLSQEKRCLSSALGNQPKCNITHNCAFKNQDLGLFSNISLK